MNGKPTVIDHDGRCSKELFINRLRRLADDLEHNQQFDIQLAGEHIYTPKEVQPEVDIIEDDSRLGISFQLVWDKRKRG